jgi:integrase/recombinase XerC
MNACLQDFEQYLKEHGRADRTASAYVSDAGRYVAWAEQVYELEFVPSMLNRSDLRDYMTHARQVEKVLAATQNRYKASLKIFASYLGVADPTDAIRRAQGQELAPQSLNESEYRRLRLAANEAVRTARTEAALRQALRDRAVLTLLVDAGLREGEVVALTQASLQLGERKGKVKIVGAKGNKDRNVPLDKDSVEMLQGWLCVRGAGEGTVFQGKFGDGLQERGIQKIVARYGQLARIEHVHPHMLRHTAAYRWMKGGASLVQVAQLLGHSSIEVTRRYTLSHYSDLESVVEAA